jgi:Putative auto-transporter adhesin, head GIN domain
MRVSAGIALVAIGFIPGCHGSLMIGPPAIVGSGVSKEESRPVDAFHALDAGSTLQVNVSVTPGEKPSLKITGDDNLVPLIESVVSDGTLILRLKDNSSISPKLPLLAEVVVSELGGVEASGAASVKIKGVVKAYSFRASASGAAQVSVEGVEALEEAAASAEGASQVVLTGYSAILKVAASGASQVKAEGLKVEEAHVSISGASGVELRVNKSVAGDVSGASHLDLYGSPAKQSVTTSGASQVTEKK